MVGWDGNGKSRSCMRVWVERGSQVEKGLLEFIPEDILLSPGKLASSPPTFDFRVDVYVTGELTSPTICASQILVCMSASTLENIARPDYMTEIHSLFEPFRNSPVASR